mmetsp:Transcript_14783/g.30515  ORF Transcript_14783/g.30515 Transcript_14783/m.30515 type:complete len:205 (+) Transcript_14783:1175-1789(+)
MEGGTRGIFEALLTLATSLDTLGCREGSDDTPGSGVVHTQRAADADDDPEDSGCFVVLSEVLLLAGLVTVGVAGDGARHSSGLETLGTTGTKEDRGWDARTFESRGGVPPALLVFCSSKRSVEVGDLWHGTRALVAVTAGSVVPLSRSAISGSDFLVVVGSCLTKPSFRKTSRLVRSVLSRTLAKPTWLSRLRKEDILRMPKIS